MIHNQRALPSKKLKNLHDSEMSATQKQSNKSQNKTIGNNSMGHQSCFRGYPVLFCLGHLAGLVSERMKEPSICAFLNSCTLRACYNYRRDKGKSSKAFWYSFLHNVSIMYLCLITPLLSLLLFHHDANIYGET